MQKAIVTAAITGLVHTPAMSDHFHITLDEIAGESIRDYEAGGAVVHIHVRDAETGKPSPDMELFEKVITKVKSKSNVLICTSTGGRLVS